MTLPRDLQIGMPPDVRWQFKSPIELFQRGHTSEAPHQALDTSRGPGPALERGLT